MSCTDKVLSCLTITAFFLFFTARGFVQSAVPPYIHYQGRLVDQATGAPINDSKSITFSLYDSETGEPAIYYQIREVTINEGVFSVYLGKGEGYYDGNRVADGIPVEVFTDHSARYLGIKLEDSQIEMYPRQLITSAAYAYKAERASKADYAMKAGEAENLMGQVTVSPSGNVGIGTTSPGGLLDVGGGNLVVDPNSGNIGIGTIRPDSLLNLVSEGPTNAKIRIDSFDNTPWIEGRMARGTAAAPTIALNGDQGIRVQGYGYDGAVYQTMSQIVFEVDGSPELNDMPGRISFWTTPDESTGLVERMRITNRGNVGIGTTNPIYNLDVIGNIRAKGSVYYGGSEGYVNGTAYTKPDFVFEDGYKVMTIEEVENYLKEEGHLPWMTSVKKESEENGDTVDMTRMAFETVETVENLQIQIIELTKVVKAQQRKIEEMEARLSEMQ